MKNKLLLSLFILISLLSNAQLREGQNFCDESPEGNYFPLSLNKKNILWADTYYTEDKIGTKIINGKTYLEFKQNWKNIAPTTLFLRKENNVVYQYEECCKKETIRYDSNFKKDHLWKSADGLREYKIVSYKGKLKTPYCSYKNLLVINAKLSFGEFKFYYLKGHGYIGATENNKLVSCISPSLETLKEK
ncbi:hypothetical protein [uncultured Maribacter sp.]|uniref:hypothetical protein n=1 Tax=uncultured Maribacter sp. TaxID=431308 RepID=UPI00262B9E68|nr:hypothetical protein [uncultured Maribacter sp.]